MTVLDRIIDYKRKEVARDRAARALSILKKRPSSIRRDFAAALAARGLSMIAEIKRRSPSSGSLRRRVDAARIARQFEAGGARAISVLTDRRFFGGSLADLAEARRAANLPVLRKDFIIDEYQIRESMIYGCDAILLIARVLELRTLAGFIALAANLGMACLVEVRDRAELEKSLAAGAAIIGINNRDLNTMRVDLKVSLELIKLIPAGRLAVSESGIVSRRHLHRLVDAGFDAVLIGSVLMKSRDPAEKIRELKHDEN
jgi:indole-3-glycerol phosphate synthase